MKTLIIAAAAVALTSGALLTAPAEAAPFKRYHGNHVTPYERVAIAKSKVRLDRIKHRVHADGRVTSWERARLNAARSKHSALAYRLRHN